MVFLFLILRRKHHLCPNAKVPVTRTTLTNTRRSRCAFQQRRNVPRTLQTSRLAHPGLSFIANRGGSKPVPLFVSSFSLLPFFLLYRVVFTLHSRASLPSYTSSSYFTFGYLLLNWISTPLVRLVHLNAPITTPARQWVDECNKQVYAHNGRYFLEKHGKRYRR